MEENRGTEDESNHRKLLLALLSCCILISALLGAAAIVYLIYSESEPIREKSRFIQEPPHYKMSPCPLTTTTEPSLVLITDKKNYSDAFHYCEQQMHLRLWIPESAEQETIFTEWIANTSDCNEAFLGYRFVLDKQWHPIGSPDGPYSFGDMSEMITCEDYDWGSEHCLRFETTSTCANNINNIPCTTEGSCYICQNRDGCLSSECLLLNTESLDYFQAKNKCLAEDQKLLFISNEKELIKLREIVKGKPNFDDCGFINLDLTTTPVYENYKEEEVQFLPSFFDFSVSGKYKIKEMCVKYDKTEKKLIRENCTSTHCFVCGCI